ncbi:MAG: hypothetical protein DWC11_00640 [Candidatus Poseidoniales archaeon]|nr:MAG: hypothetical protein DWC11_00640 [Candidatus Poseidoniales archaeon]
MTLGFSTVDVAISVSVDGFDVNLVQVVDLLEVFDGDCIGIVRLVPNEHEFLATGAEVRFHFFHLDAFIPVLVNVRCRRTRRGMGAMLVNGDETVPVGVQILEPIHGPLFASFWFERFVHIIVVIVVDRRQVGFEPCGDDAEAGDVIDDFHGDVEASIGGGVHVPGPSNTVASGPALFAPLSTAWSILEEHLPIVGLGFALEFDAPFIAPRVDLEG